MPRRCGSLRKLRRRHVVLEDAIDHGGFNHDDLVGAKRVGLHRVTPHGQERFVDFLDHVRAAEVQHLGDVLVPQPVLVKIERAGLEVGAHGPVEDDDAFLHQLNERLSHGCFRFLLRVMAGRLDHPFIRIYC